MSDIKRTCKITGKEFVVTEWEQAFLKKMEAPLPTLCVDERHRKRLAHRNERSIYKDKCDLTGKAIVSLYSPDKPYVVYAQDVWYGDKWDARDYGRDFDFNRPFFEQFYELQQTVPHMALVNLRGENSEYCNITNSNKNCYLVFGGDYCEDCLYSVFSMYCKDSSDLYWVNDSELCYDCIDCVKCYRVKYAQNCDNCSDSAFLFDCKNCESCFGCVGLRNKKFHIFNKPFPEDEYKEKVALYHLDSRKGVQYMKKEFNKFRLNFPHRDAIVINSQNVLGDQLTDCKNCLNCFDLTGPAEDCKDVILGGYNMHHVVSSDHVGFKSDLFYEMIGSIEGHHNAFCAFSWTSSDTYYCDFVLNSHDLFGCSNMNRAQYCILNKQYKKDEYFDLRTRIVEHMKKTGEWGEFFPMEYSLFDYNETVAQDFFPVTKDEADSMGLRWREEGQEKLESGYEIPDSILGVEDGILNETLVCEKTGKGYKIIRQELELYKKLQVPVPHFAPETRNRIRFAARNPRKLWDRKCDKCQAAIKTTYAPDRPEKVYCEACYLKEVY